MNKAHFTSIPTKLEQMTKANKEKKELAKAKSFHRTVNSVDIQNSQGVKSKQIMFYSDLVHLNDLNKLFTVLDKTPSSTSLSI